MRRTLKKKLNLNKLKTGCSPCMNEAKKMQEKYLIEIFRNKIERSKNVLFPHYLKKIKV